MKKLISIICPTHRRPELQERFATSVYENAYKPEICEIVFGIDNDDEMAIKAADNLKEKYGEDFIKVCLVEPNQEKLASIVNQCYQMTRGQILGNAADDVVFRSKNWDIVVLKQFEKFEDRIMLLWGDDGLWKGALASHFFLHENWAKVTGYLQPELFYADWTDHWMQRLAKRLGRAVVIHDRERLFLEHGGMEKDETYYKVKKRREKNIEEGLNFDRRNPPANLQKLHDADLKKLHNFIERHREGPIHD